tara:strand:- start:3114 stop:3338 length:225 start_codon:yes stop_codon:yes gene_type:complete
MSKWVLTTLGKQRYPIFVQVDNPNYTPSKEDIVVNEATFFKNKNRLVDVTIQTGLPQIHSQREKIWAFKDFVEA